MGKHVQDHSILDTRENYPFQHVTIKNDLDSALYGQLVWIRGYYSGLYGDKIAVVLPRAGTFAFDREDVRA